jgi:hypothetical protein
MTTMLARLTSAAALATAFIMLTVDAAAAHVSPEHAGAAGQSGNTANLLAAVGITACAAFAYWRWRRRML